ncbi:unnamed protein product [Rodentolepis nana]|uniref:Midasin n=1 Tax=Rodentolepis nana TaxID=102285 RepID=A0A0R3T4G5_RODNA|nr:unnamed protein product [Rodentolepis nana]
MNRDAKRDVHVQKCILTLARQLWPDVIECIEWRMRHFEQLAEDSPREELTFENSEMYISREDYSEETMTESGVDCNEILNEGSERELEVPGEEIKEVCVKYISQEDYNEIFTEEEEEGASNEVPENGVIYHETQERIGKKNNYELEGEGLEVIENNVHEDEIHKGKEKSEYIEVEAREAISDVNEKLFNQKKCEKIREVCLKEVLACDRECDEVNPEESCLEEPEKECAEYEDYTATSNVEIEVTAYLEGVDGEYFQIEGQDEPVEESGKLEELADSSNELGEEYTNNVDENVEGLVKEKYDYKIVKTEEEYERQDEDDKFLETSANEEVFEGAKVHDECDKENQNPEGKLFEEDYVANEENKDRNHLQEVEEIHDQAPEQYAQNNDSKLEYASINMHAFTEKDEIFPSEAQSHYKEEQPKCQLKDESRSQLNAEVCLQIPASDIECLLMLAREVCPEIQLQLGCRKILK